jgi:hypothetical protein
METPYTVRTHNLYTSGTGRGLPHWSSGNVYHEDTAGRPHYDWTLVDPVFDAWVHRDHSPRYSRELLRLRTPQRATLAPEGSIQAHCSSR